MFFTLVLLHMQLVKKDDKRLKGSRCSSSPPVNIDMDLDLTHQNNSRQFKIKSITRIRTLFHGTLTLNPAPFSLPTLSKSESRRLGQNFWCSQRCHEKQSTLFEIQKNNFTQSQHISDTLCTFSKCSPWIIFKTVLDPLTMMYIPVNYQYPKTQSRLGQVRQQHAQVWRKN